MSKKQQTQQNKIADGIYFHEMNDNATHFIAYKNGKIMNPYDYYQFPKTHGFCQFFAFFLYTGDTAEFKTVSFDGTFKGAQFKNYVNNSYDCFHKILKLLKKKKCQKRCALPLKMISTTLLLLHGKNTELNEEPLLSNFYRMQKKIPYEQFYYEMGENYDSYGEDLGEGHDQFEKQGNKFFEQQKRKKAVDIEKFEADESLCHANGGETQFEAFQSIIANSFRGGRNSVYSKLLAMHNIKLIEDDIYNLVDA